LSDAHYLFVMLQVWTVRNLAGADQLARFRGGRANGGSRQNRPSRSRQLL